MHTFESHPLPILKPTNNNILCFSSGIYHPADATRALSRREFQNNNELCRAMCLDYCNHFQKMHLIHLYTLITISREHTSLYTHGAPLANQASAADSFAQSYALQFSIESVEMHVVHVHMCRIQLS